MRQLASWTRLLCRRYPLLSGCGTIANSAAFRWLSARAGNVDRTNLPDGATILLRINDFVGRSVFFFGDLDPKISWLCSRLLRPGDVLIDIGANIGLVALQGAGLVGSQGRVLAFEPQPQLAAMLEASARLNAYRHVSVHPIALSGSDGVMCLHVPGDNSGSASLEPRPDEAGTELRVEVRHAARQLSGFGLESVRLMKIDVEGHEAEVLSGARDFLATVPTDAIIFEEHRRPCWEQSSVAMLRSLNFSVWAIPRSYLSVHLLEAVPENAARLGTSHDFLAVSASAFAELATTLKLVRRS